MFENAMFKKQNKCIISRINSQVNLLYYFSTIGYNLSNLQDSFINQYLLNIEQI